MDSEMNHFKCTFLKCLKVLNKLECIVHYYNNKQLFPEFSDEYVVKKVDFEMLQNEFEDVEMELDYVQKGITKWILLNADLIRDRDPDQLIISQLLDKIDEKKFDEPENLSDAELLFKQFELGWEMCVCLSELNIIYLDCKWADGCPMFCKGYEGQTGRLVRVEGNFKTELANLVEFLHELVDWTRSSAALCNDEITREMWAELLDLIKEDFKTDTSW